MKRDAGSGGGGKPGLERELEGRGSKKPEPRRGEGIFVSFGRIFLHGTKNGTNRRSSDRLSEGSSLSHPCGTVNVDSVRVHRGRRAGGRPAPLWFQAVNHRAGGLGKEEGSSHAQI